MKFTIAFIFLLVINSIESQIQLDSCGVDNKLELNIYESNYLDSIFSISNFTFENKKVEFRMGNYGHLQLTKSRYFTDVKAWLNSDDGRIHEDVIILTEDEKINYGNYDAIIISWSKISVTEGTRIKFLKTIVKENQNKN